MKQSVKGLDLAKKLGISPLRGIEAVIKAQLIAAVIKEVQKQDLTHVELAKKAKLPRSAVTGILSGSLQKITIDTHTYSHKTPRNNRLSNHTWVRPTTA